MNKRIFNFSAGPATMPEEILKQAQRELLNFSSTGMSIMEMSHRSKIFESVLNNAKENIINLLSIPESHDVLFLQGGASLQFSMVPMNLCIDNLPVQLIQTGSWTKKATKEIQKIASCNIIASSEDKNFTYIPDINQIPFDEPSSFVYLCSNNTIYGTQFKHFPDTGSIPLVADMSSDIFSAKLPISKFGLIFAGAQKNVGPAGVTIIIIKKDLAERASSNIPSMLQYRNFISSNSLYNTVPTFGIYMIKLVTDWLINLGGISSIEKINQDKAQLLYDAIDQDDFYFCPVEKNSRSLMNIVFRCKGGEDQEKEFIAGAEKKGLSGLKGHRSVGGIRASIYNAHPIEGVVSLINYMDKFKKSQ